MFDTLITAFEGLEDYQPIHHADFIAHHSNLEDSYLETLMTNQLANCSRFPSHDPPAINSNPLVALVPNCVL